MAALFRKIGQIGKLTTVLFVVMLVAVFSTMRQPSMQINYGSGKPVSDETIADAGDPLELRWHGDSFLEFPVSR